jgi:hypothetical protein
VRALRRTRHRCPRLSRSSHARRCFRDGTELRWSSCVETGFEDRRDRAVGGRADVAAAPASRFDERRTAALDEADDAETRAEALLGMRLRPCALGMCSGVVVCRWRKRAWLDPFALVEELDRVGAAPLSCKRSLFVIHLARRWFLFRLAFRIFWLGRKSGLIRGWSVIPIFSMAKLITLKPDWIRARLSDLDRRKLRLPLYHLELVIASIPHYQSVDIQR